ncbi:hypothetical protein NDU88_006535 [Pleurodeles waltl]|uniref:Uncharacterized protein n=1 Tax=Pleurodeles waltl TaxID=8319 RepID=A0AAV7SPV1_PLEWA|nr:hypothetical protein NDU88_006535 [Pleurodeles waltl]
MKITWISGRQLEGIADQGQSTSTLATGKGWQGRISDSNQQRTSPFVFRSADCRQLRATGGKVRKNSLCAAAQQKGSGRVAFVTSPLCSDHQIGRR